MWSAFFDILLLDHFSPQSFHVYVALSFCPCVLLEMLLFSWQVKCITCQWGQKGAVWNSNLRKTYRNWLQHSPVYYHNKAMASQNKHHHYYYQSCWNINIRRISIQFKCAMKFSNLNIVLLVTQKGNCQGFHNTNHRSQWQQWDPSHQLLAKSKCNQFVQKHLEEKDSRSISYPLLTIWQYLRWKHLPNTYIYSPRL